MNKVHFAVEMVTMKKMVISREEILEASKDIAARSGFQALNMRSTAKDCGIAVGSLYNYFESKDDLVIATIEAIWNEIIAEVESTVPAAGFTEYVEMLYSRIKQGNEKYPHFISVHSLSLAQNRRDKGRAAMNSYFERIKSGLLTALHTDKSICLCFFNEKCGENDFINFVLSNILSSLAKRESCDVLLEIIKKVLSKNA